MSLLLGQVHDNKLETFSFSLDNLFLGAVPRRILGYRFQLVHSKFIRVEFLEGIDKLVWVYSGCGYEVFGGLGLALAVDQFNVLVFFVGDEVLFLNDSGLSFCGLACFPFLQLTTL